MQDPSEAQQAKLIARIATSVDRLNETLALVNAEMAKASEHAADVEYVKAIVDGYVKRVEVAAQVSQAQ